MKIQFLLPASLLLAITMVMVPTFAQQKTDAKTTAAGSSKKASAASSSSASDADIAAAQKDGKVWVNTASGVYHKGGRYYGKTKQGKFMTEDEAKKAGYHEDKTEAKKGQSK